IIHRDVKPSNLFLADTPKGPRLKLLDFGISKMLSLADWERTATVTESHALLGSPRYTSPEQLKNPSNVDERTDIWALGVTMYYPLTREHPFEGESLADLLVSVMWKPPILPSSRGRDVSAAMLQVLSRCLERSLSSRFQDVGEVAAALAPLASPEWAQHAS